MVVQTLGEVPPQLAMTPDRDARLAEQAAKVGAQDVVRLLDLLAAGQRAVRDGADGQTQLEVALVKAAAPEVDPSTRALLARLERLEGRLAAGGGAPAAPAAAPAAAPPPATAPPEPTPDAPAAPDAPSAAEPEPVEAAVAVAEVSLDLPGVVELWPAILDTVRERHAMLGTVLAEARPVAVVDREVTFAFDPSQTFLRRKAEDATCRELLQEAFRTLVGVAPRVAYELRERGAAEVAEAPVLTEDEWIARLKQEFDAEEIVPDQEEPA